ncbi:ATP-binding protein [Mariprofundus ferrooxydans]|uniref:ATP-binding protein n=1 Tax=Mariprofundus ferrooxydans TaxID=314344 RepID=UPI00037FB82C|nr:ATP-binding protein [Mariprofundus ferrooxydans]
MYSLNKRLTLSLAASLALFFLAQTLMIGREVEVLSEHNLISRMKHDQEALLAALSWQPPAQIKIDPLRIPEIYERPFSGHYYQITIAGVTVYSRSLWDEKLPAQSTPVARDIPGPVGQRLLMLAQTVSLHDQAVEIRIAEDVSHVERTTSAFQRHLLLFAAAAVLALLVLQGWLVQSGLKPLLRIRKQLSQLEKGEIDRVSIATASEIMPLVEEINRLVDLIRLRLDRSRHALGDLAHALKTPLSVVGQIIQRQPESADMAQLKEQLHGIEQRIDRELARARTAGHAPGGSWSDPSLDLGDLTRMLKQVFPDTRIGLDIPAELKIAADREDMLEVFGNLLENSCKWASGEIRCRVRAEQEHYVIQVEDDGPGIAESEYKSLLLRGARLDESRPGHGLGLAIVNEIVAAYDGEITLGRSAELGGLMIQIILPHP